MPARDLSPRLRPYFFNVVIMWLVILLYHTLPYYKNLLMHETKTTIILAALAYTLFGFCYYLFTKKERISESRGSLTFSFFKKSLGNIIKKLNRGRMKYKIEKDEKTALLFMIVKIFFLPIMLNFFFGNYNYARGQLSEVITSSPDSIILFFNYILFPFLLAFIFMIDTLWFSFGYTVETKTLKNKVLSVEPTIIGWAVALACYPPFNTLIPDTLNKLFTYVGFEKITTYTSWYANDYINLGTEANTFILRIAIVFFLSIYVWATIALGAKCSNLTNRGIISRGPYAVIRHPAYISKNLSWWMTILPILSLPAIISMSAWSFIYHLRSVTEERHLKKDPEYVKYCKKVRYRYIPYIY